MAAKYSRFLSYYEGRLTRVHLTRLVASPTRDVIKNQPLSCMSADCCVCRNTSYNPINVRLYGPNSFVTTLSVCKLDALAQVVRKGYGVLGLHPNDKAYIKADAGNSILLLRDDVISPWNMKEKGRERTEVDHTRYGKLHANPKFQPLPTFGILNFTPCKDSRLSQLSASKGAPCLEELDI
ncbi:hypothetical protein J6590_034166 [Homalodisca vitripennis]|nr:hypothetical protein J6590_034166 [Homalodisca vitripennis]